MSKITVEITIPDGNTCLHESGFCCNWILKHTGSGQTWCRAFDDVRINMLKCPACLKACKESEVKTDE